MNQQTIPQSSNSQFFAEVIESSLDSWVAQSWKWDLFPIFGSIVIIESNNRKFFSIVYQINTGSSDSVRQPFAFQKTKAELLRDQPQIFEFLRTTFSCLALGYEEDSEIFHMLSPEPPKIHSFIRQASPIELISFFNNPNYLQIFFSNISKIPNLDELLLALLRHLKQNDVLNHKNFTDFLELYSMLNDNDYKKLKLFLRRIEPVIKEINQLHNTE
ncbi:MAG: hypothetical protein P4L22_06005 [Candidatus Babeliales bacterium]|nr:hypothetical protein [Candidatus Babeliales bacterium]